MYDDHWFLSYKVELWSWFSDSYHETDYVPDTSTASSMINCNNKQLHCYVTIRVLLPTVFYRQSATAMQKLSVELNNNCPIVGKTNDDFNNF